MTETGNTVQERASLHEKAVQAVAAGEVPKTSRKPRKATSRPAGSTLDYHHKVPEKLWTAAQQIVDDETNSYTRIEIASSEEVYVR